MKYQSRVVVLLLLLRGSAAFCETTDAPISFDTLVQRVLQHHPKLAAGAFEVRAGEAAAKMSEVPANPEVEVELTGMRAAEIECRLGQKIPLGGKVKAQKALGEHSLLRIKGQRAIIKRTLHLGCIEKFIAVAVARERFHRADSLQLLTGMMLDQIRTRVENGAARPTDTLRVQLELGRQKMEVEELGAALGIAREQFARFTADSQLTEVTGILNQQLQLPPFATPEAAIDNRPDRKDARASLEQFTLEKNILAMARYPDLVAQAGFIRNREAKTNDPIVAFSLDLPLKSGTRLRSEMLDCDRSAQELQLKQERYEIVTALGGCYKRFAALDKKRSFIENVQMSQAYALVTALDAAYSRGNGGLLEVLDARKEIIRYTLELLDIHEARAQCALEVMALSGLDIDIIMEEHK